MIRRFRHLLVAAAALTFVDAPFGEAAAQTPPTAESKAEARSRFDGGLALFEDGNNAAALAEFQRAYELIPNPVVLFNIGLVYAAMNKPAEAAAALQKLVKEPTSLSPDLMNRANQTLAQQLGRTAEIAVECNVAATIEVDNVEAAKAPLSAPLRLAGGSHIVGAIAAGYTPQRKQVTVAGGAKASLAFTLVPMEGRLAHLTLKSRLPGAEVLLDGELVGRTPFATSLTLMPGSHRVELTRPGYRTARQELSLGDGASGEITLEPAEDPEQIARLGGDLKLAITETEALVTIDGTSRGPYVASMRLAPGVHRLLVERGGFRPSERDVMVTSGSTTVVPITLDPTPEMREVYVSRARTQRTWAWIGIGGGLALAAGGTGYLVYNASAKSDARDALDAAVGRLERREGVCDIANVGGDAKACNDQVQSAQSNLNNVRDRDIIGYVGLGVGAAAASLGLLFLVTGDNPHKYDRKPASEARSLTPVFAFTPGSTTFAVLGTF